MTVQKIVVLDETGNIPIEELPDGIPTLPIAESDVTNLVTDLAAKPTLTEVKADSDVADAISKKHSNTLDHSNSLDHSNYLDHAEAHTHAGVYEPADATIQTHVVSAHAPSDAQKNSDIIKAEVEAVLTGEIASHSHAGGGGEAFPIGSVFLAVVNTDPATLLGYGEWSQIASGKFLVGQDGGDTDFNVAEETGGEKTHTLTEAEMPTHTHIQDQHRHQTLRERSATTGSASTQIARTADTSSTVDTAVYTGYTTPTNQNAGSGSAHNNLPPYFVVYIWKRTA